MKTNSDDYAFSSVRDINGIVYWELGLTKREYFAAMALQGLLANKYVLQEHAPEEAVYIANELINELNKETK